MADHVERTLDIEDRIPVCTVAELEDKGKLLVEINGKSYGIFKVNGGYYAWRNVCPHAAAPVCEGVVCGTRLPSLVHEYKYGKDREILRCPWHGWEFDLLTGRHLADETVKLRGADVVTDGERVYLLLPGKGERP